MAGVEPTGSASLPGPLTTSRSSKEAHQRDPSTQDGCRLQGGIEGPGQAARWGVTITCHDGSTSAHYVDDVQVREIRGILAGGSKNHLKSLLRRLARRTRSQKGRAGHRWAVGTSLAFDRHRNLSRLGSFRAWSLQLPIYWDMAALEAATIRRATNCFHRSMADIYNGASDVCKVNPVIRTSLGGEPGFLGQCLHLHRTLGIQVLVFEIEALVVSQTLEGCEWSRISLFPGHMTISKAGAEEKSACIQLATLHSVDLEAELDLIVVNKSWGLVPKRPQHQAPVFLLLIDYLLKVGHNRTGSIMSSHLDLARVLNKEKSGPSVRSRVFLRGIAARVEVTVNEAASSGLARSRQKVLYQRVNILPGMGPQSGWTADYFQIKYGYLYVYQAQGDVMPKAFWPLDANVAIEVVEAATELTEDLDLDSETSQAVAEDNWDWLQVLIDFTHSWSLMLKMAFPTKMEGLRWHRDLLSAKEFHLDPGRLEGDSTGGMTAPRPDDWPRAGAETPRVADNWLALSPAFLTEDEDHSQLHIFNLDLGSLVPKIPVLSVPYSSIRATPSLSPSMKTLEVECDDGKRLRLTFPDSADLIKFNQTIQRRLRPFIPKLQPWTN